MKILHTLIKESKIEERNTELFYSLRDRISNATTDEELMALMGELKQANESGELNFAHYDELQADIGRKISDEAWMKLSGY